MANHWSDSEVEAAVADYFRMLQLELTGRKYNKTEHRRALMEQLNDRSDGSVELKHQNISAVLIEMGIPYIDGYKPRFQLPAVAASGGGSGLPQGQSQDSATVCCGLGGNTSSSERWIFYLPGRNHRRRRSESPRHCRAPSHLQPSWGQLLGTRSSESGTRRGWEQFVINLVSVLASSRAGEGIILLNASSKYRQQLVHPQASISNPSKLTAPTGSLRLRPRSTEKEHTIFRDAE